MEARSAISRAMCQDDAVIISMSAPSVIAKEIKGSTLILYPSIPVRAEAPTNFERPCTPRTSLRSPRNFGNARFRRFANFDFSTTKKKNLKKIQTFFFGFSFFLVDFRGARLCLTSKSRSSRFFALDGQIFRSVRRLGLIFRFCTVRT